MRISDWSSDVCSSDLIDLAIAELEPGKPDDVQFIAGGLNAHIRSAGVLAMVVTQHADFVLAPAPRLQGAIDAGREGLVQALRRGLPDMVGAQIRTVRVVIGHGVRVEELVHAIPVTPVRSEEHTSELQSLMRISYAVFCLKKKTSDT